MHAQAPSRQSRLPATRPAGWPLGHTGVLVRNQPPRVGATASSVDWGLVIFQHHSGLCGDRLEGEEGEGWSTRGGHCNPPGEGGSLD